MSNFYYFVPGQPDSLIPPGSELPEDLLRISGLLPAFDDARQVTVETFVQRCVESVGACASQKGVMLYAKDRLGTLPRVRAAQHPDLVWTQARGHWIGYDKEQPPTPADLLKRKAITVGWEVPIGEQKWLVPCVRSPDVSREGLPRIHSLDLATEAIVSRRTEEHERLWKLCGEIIDKLIKGIGDEPVTVEWRIEAMLAILQSTYRLTRSSVAVLQSLGVDLLNAVNRDSILFAACDLQLLEEYAEKKTEEICRPGSSSALTGSREDCLATGQPEVSSK